MELVGDSTAPAVGAEACWDGALPLAGLVRVGEKLGGNDGEVVGVVTVAIDGLDEVADVGKDGECSLVVKGLEFGKAWMEAVDVATVVDGEQGILGEGQALAILRIEVVVLLGGGDWDDGVVAVVSSAEEHADEGLITGGACGEGVHLAEAGEQVHCAKCGYGSQGVAHEISSGADEHGYSSSSARCCSSWR